MNYMAFKYPNHRMLPSKFCIPCCSGPELAVTEVNVKSHSDISWSCKRHSTCSSCTHCFLSCLIFWMPSWYTMWWPKMIGSCQMTYWTKRLTPVWYRQGTGTALCNVSSSLTISSSSLHFLHRPRSSTRHSVLLHPQPAPGCSTTSAGIEAGQRH